MDPAALAPATGHVPTAAELLDDLARLADGMAEPAVDRISGRTRAAYEGDWRQWEAWCDLHELAPLPVEPEMVRLYVADMATQVRPGGVRRYRATTVERHLAALAWRSRQAGGIHDLARHPRIAPLVAALRVHPAAQSRRTHPLTAADVTSVVLAMHHHTWPEGVTAARDTLAILTGRASLLRRSTVASLSVDEALSLAFPEPASPVLCARCARQRWLLILGAADRAAAMERVYATGRAHAWGHVCAEPPLRLDPHGPEPLLRTVTRSGHIASIGLSDSAVNQVLKRRLTAAGLDASRYGYDSLRAGAAQ